jgi:hypothetical protein
VLPAGRPVAVAEAVRAAGGTVELVGKVADDLAGDAIVIELGRRGIGHAALARTGDRTPVTDLPADSSDGAVDDPGSATDALTVEGDRTNGADAAPTGLALPDGLPLDPADVKLAHGYLPEIGAIVAVGAVADDAAKVVADSAGYHSVPLVALVEPGSRVPAPFADAIVLEAAEAEDSFDRLVGAFAVRLERGAEAAEAFRDAVAAGGWERASG